MKIRHVLDAQGYQALYILPHDPYIREIPLTNMSLIKRKPEENESADEIVGFVNFGTVFMPADEIPGFVAYINPVDMESVRVREMYRAYAITNSQDGEWVYSGEEPQEGSIDE